MSGSLGLTEPCEAQRAPIKKEAVGSTIDRDSTLQLPQGQKGAGSGRPGLYTTIFEEFPVLVVGLGGSTSATSVGFWPESSPLFRRAKTPWIHIDFNPSTACPCRPCPPPPGAHAYCRLQTCRLQVPMPMSGHARIDCQNYCLPLRACWPATPVVSPPPSPVFLSLVTTTSPSKSRSHLSPGLLSTPLAPIPEPTLD